MHTHIWTHVVAGKSFFSLPSAVSDSLHHAVGVLFVSAGSWITHCSPILLEACWRTDLCNTAATSACSRAGGMALDELTVLTCAEFLPPNPKVWNVSYAWFLTCRVKYLTWRKAKSSSFLANLVPMTAVREAWCSCCMCVQNGKVKIRLQINLLLTKQLVVLILIRNNIITNTKALHRWDTKLTLKR